MRKSFGGITSIMLVCALGVTLLVSGCGGGNSGSTGSNTIVTGVAATGAPLSGTVSLKDSSDAAREINTATAADGSYAFDVTGLAAPFMLKIEWTDGSSSRQMYSMATGPGTANINPLSNAAVAVAAHISDLTSLYKSTDSITFKTIAKNIPAAVDSLRAKLSPLFEQYKTAQDPITDTFRADHTGMDKMFDEVTIEVSGGNIAVMNHTGGMIFSAPVADVPAGTFHPENMPGMPGTGPAPAPAPVQDGALLYSTNCSGCHGSLAVTGKRGATAARIQAAITGKIGGMGGLSTLTAAQIQAIADVLAATPSPAPAPADGATLYNNNCRGCHGALATSSMRGTTAAKIQSAITNNTGGMKSLSTLTASQVQAIADALGTTAPIPTPTPTPTPTPAPTPAPTLDGAALYTTNCGRCHGSLATSGKRGTTAAKIQTAINNNAGGMGSLSNLTALEVQAIANALGTTPTPTPTPAPTPTPTPTPAPTVDGAALYTNNCGGCHGALATSGKRGTTAAKIQSAINNNAGGMGSLSSLTATQVQAIADSLSSTAPAPAPAPADGASLYATYCGSCHGTLTRSDVQGASASKIQSEISGTRQMNSLSGLTSTQIQAIANAL
ncbi:MAG: hypothetical protein A2010_01370 [Nitrospirae bacterium GWD2_57_9]|nr:MAG: hypothetical protein A2010_01370 [Nitrospirae bacterium GWD2_57_9]